MQVCFVNCTVRKCKQSNMVYTSQIAFIVYLQEYLLKVLFYIHIYNYIEINILFLYIYNTIYACCSESEITPRIYFILNTLKYWFLINYVIYIVDIIIVYVSPCLVDMQM